MGGNRGWLWLTAGVLLALLAGGMAFMALARAIAQPAGMEIFQNRIQVVVAACKIPLRAIIQEDDVQLKEMPTDLVPQGAVCQLEEAVGKIAMTEFFPGEVILAPRLADPTVKGKNIAFTLKEDKVLVAIPPQGLMSKIGLLKPGDKVDILVSLEKREEEGLVTALTLQNLEIEGIIKEVIPQEKVPAEAKVGRPPALLFALDPQDALILKYMIDIGGIIDIALRAPTNERMFETQPVGMDYLFDRYRLSR